MLLFVHIAGVVVTQAADLANRKRIRQAAFPGGFRGPVKVPADFNERCARDQKWKLMAQAIERQVCDCKKQFQQVHEVYRLWSCTHQQYVNPYPPVTMAQYQPPPVRVCHYLPNVTYALNTVWDQATVWDASLNDYRILGTAVRFPRPGDEAFYFVAYPQRYTGSMVVFHTSLRPRATQGHVKTPEPTTHYTSPSHKEVL